MSLSKLAFIYKTFRTIRGVLFCLLGLAIILPMVLYLLLSSGWGQTLIRQEGQKQLTQLLGTEVNIGSVKFSPFNRLLIKEVKIADDNDTTALSIDEIDARFELWDLILNQKIIIDYASLQGLDLKLYRDSVGAPLNIHGIIDKLSKKEDTKDESPFRLRLNDISIERSRFSYDVLDVPNQEGRFDPSHIKLDSLFIDAFVPILSNNNYIFSLRNLGFVDASGFRLNDLQFLGRLSQERLDIEDLQIDFGSSLIRFANITTPVDSIKNIAKIGSTHPIDLSIKDGSHIFIPDFAAFVPVLEDLPFDVNINLSSEISRDSIRINVLDLNEMHNTFSVEFAGFFTDLKQLPAVGFDDVMFKFQTDSSVIRKIISLPNLPLSEKAKMILSALGNTKLICKTDGSLEQGNLKLGLNSAIGNVDGNVKYYHQIENKAIKFDGSIDVDTLSLLTLTGNKDFESLTGIIDIKGQIRPNAYECNVSADIKDVYYKNYRYNDIIANAYLSNHKIDTDITINDPNIEIALSGYWNRQIGMHNIEGDIHIAKLHLDSLNLYEKYKGYNLEGITNLSVSGSSIDNFKAEVKLHDFSFKQSNGKGIKLNNFEIDADNIKDNPSINISSDFINGSLDGPFSFSTLIPTFKSIYSHLLPALVPSQSLKESDRENIHNKRDELLNEFSFEISISNCEELCEFFDLPVTIIDTSTINGNFSGQNKYFFTTIDIPWIQQGGNIIEDTAIALGMDENQDKGIIYITSLIPTKKGDMDIVATVRADNGHLDTKIDWSLARTIPINGTIDFTTIFNRDPDDNLITQVNFNPGEVNFGDETWNIQPSMITYYNNKVLVNNFALLTPSQIIAVNGVAGQEDTDELKIELRNIQLINIFETLEIDKALISGYATGIVEGHALLSKTPIISCDKLSVKSIGYNYCTLGDADVKLSVDNGGKYFRFEADITGEMGQHSYLDGYIEPGTEGLDLNIEADHVKVGFMKPFMEAFTSDVEGYASGKAHLFGTFKYIDLTGDIDAQDLKIKIDFTNTWYHASDSIHIRPGIIDLKDITIYDEYGNTAKLNGYVGHTFFHDAVFDFNITDAKNFLSYDVSEKLSPDWYGRIFGNGAATVKGRPGVVDIGVNMATADNSTFTFVLSDSEVADEYSFITFRDATPKAEQDSIIGKNVIPQRVQEVKLNRGQNAEDTPTAYNMDVNIDILPQAQIIIVMDPVGGDRIKSNGSGHMRMTYGSVENDIKLYGTYTLERGSYNFTLQDIIIKDFTIKEGSSITFLGDPYSAQLDIKAYYQVNANLSDLDESFLQDKDLNRTNVPVRALLLVTGDMRQPDITFDLEFPTLQQDIYRKVRSIVSTEDMMNRQIIYLLALNRFYTPEYMASTTKGNELFSVASSTLSSQLSSILGKLSDNWSIAPNLRSDRGDFSDLEVDLTLSSSLLNNRLLFNGNFGYRDKSLNTNQFVGDFDIEYLLNRSGEWRLKAYNRYNDQNYYLRTAQTTQGVGLVYRRDFDKTFRFLKHLRSNKKKETDDVTIENINIRENIIPHDTIISDSIQQILIDNPNE